MVSTFLWCHRCYNIGYLRITDFGIARQWRAENSQDTSGTPGYMGKWDRYSIKIISIYSSWGHVQVKSQHTGWLLRRWSDGLRMHVWKSNLFHVKPIFSIFRDPMSVNLDKRSEITFFLNKYKLRKMKSLKVGPLKQQTSLIRQVFFGFSFNKLLTFIYI